MSEAHNTINRLAGGTIPAYTLVKKGADDNNVVAAAAATDKIIGVTVGPTTMSSVSGDRVDVVVNALAEAKAGGTIVAGDALTSDASGQVIATTTTANRLIGFALKDAASGDIVQINVQPGVY